MTKLILIIEDEHNQRQMLKLALNKADFDVEEAASGHEALDVLSCETANRFDLVLLDMVIGDIGGRDVLHHLRKMWPDLPVIVLTGHGSIDNAVIAMQDGAVDFISKPVDLDRLKTSIENALQTKNLSDEVSHLNRRRFGHLGFDDLIGASDAMKRAVGLAKKGADTNIPILLEGESGVGKEVFARAILDKSSRNGKAFIVVNCGAIPRNLVESILFGHEKGAFTGAMEKHSGKFVEADGGTLFLDEIGDLPLDLQVKLLRVLQEGEVDPVGSREPVKVDVRLISATNRNLKEMVETGEFREDLFYRLNIFPIRLPPLRDRVSDIEYLVSHFIENISITEGYPSKEISPNALELLKSYTWPGNVRQLENSLFRAVVLSEGSVITRADFPHIDAAIYSQPDFQKQKDNGNSCAGQKQLIIGGDILSGLDENGDIRTIQDVERDMISFALKKYNGHMSEVARRLGVGRSTLYRKVSEFELGRDLP